MILVLNPEITARAAELREYAEDSTHWWDGTGGSPGDCDKYIMEVPVGYKLAYTVDIMEDRSLMRHLSVSRSTEKGPVALSRMEMLMFTQMFGFGPNVEMGLIPPDPPWVVHAIESFIEA
jgi:hypothetical protein